MKWKPINKLWLVVLIIFVLGAQDIFAQATITVRGNWRKRVRANQITEAGNDFPNSYQSSRTKTRITIRKTPTSSLFPWRVDVRGDKVLWDNRLTLLARRTDSGTSITAGATITGGTVYQQLTNTDQSFFSGTGSIRNIHVQYKVTGVTVLIPAGVLYETTVVYTLIEL